MRWRSASAGTAPVEPLLRLPLTERRARLDALDLPTTHAGGRFERSHLVVAADVDALEAAFTESRARRNEGLMVKDPESRYAPGRRGLGWLKMKKALATIDCVVVGVEVGHGKRHGVLSDYTFAVRDTETDKLVNIGKAYSGLTDAEIAEMTRWFEAHTIARYGRYHQVEPTVVVEIAFDVIVRSARHGSGFSLRFPRIARLRPDKTVDEIDTVETVTALYEGLQHGSELLVTAGSKPARHAGRGPLHERLDPRRLPPLEHTRADRADRTPWSALSTDAGNRSAMARSFDRRARRWSASRADVTTGRPISGSRDGASCSRQLDTSPLVRVSASGTPHVVDWHAPGRGPGPRARLAIDRQVQPVAPFGPAAVVDRDVLVAEQGQHERELGRRDPRAVVADHPAAARRRWPDGACRAAPRRRAIAGGRARWCRRPAR